MTRITSLQRLLTENVQPARGHRGWHGGPTPLGALRGVSAEEAAWRPARGRHTIWELALHAAYWTYAVRRRLEAIPGPGFPRRPANWPAMPDVPDERSWRLDVRLLRAERARLLAVIPRLPTTRLDRRPAGSRWTVGQLVLGIAQHDAYHAGQIQLMKRLWAARS